MLIVRACRRALPPTRSRSYAAAAVQMRRQDLQRFLQQHTPYTILPTPLPQDARSDQNDLWFSDSSTQELMAVMDACLQNLYDVPRAKGIFDRLRSSSGVPLEARVYNAFLLAYLKMAAGEAEYWVESIWELFESTAIPDTGTYALMLLTVHRFPKLAKKSITALLSDIVHQGDQEPDFTIARVVADRAFTDDDEAALIIKELSKSAINLNLPEVVSQLGETQALGVEDSDVPEVRPVTKDENVPFNLDTLRKHLARVALARRVLPTDVNARQKLLEASVYDAAKERLARQNLLFTKIGLAEDTRLLQPDLQKWMWQWHCRLKDRLEKEIHSISETEKTMPLQPNNRKRNPVLAPYLALVKADKLSMITIVEIMRLVGSGGVFGGMKTARALISVGKAVEAEFKAHMAKQNSISVDIVPSSQRPPGDWFSHLGYRDLQRRRVAAARFMTDNEGWTAPWTQAVRSQVGGILVECLMDVAEVTRTAEDKITKQIITEEQPAFHQTYEYMRGQKLGVIRLNPAVSARLTKDPVPLHPRHLPMLVKPKPWVNYNEGGYLHSKTNVMRFKNSVEQRSYLKYASELGNVELVYAGLDVLGSTPWQINKRVFDVVLEVWNSGKRLGKMPPEVYDEPEPVAPPNYETDLQQRNVYLTRQRAYIQNKASNHSDRCSVNYKIEISRSFLGETFYLPHNVDFRGRAYPIPPHLNHIGDDLSRGLLTFAEKRPLGERGLRWLKIHLSNLYGFDKANFDERVAFVEAHMEDIYDAATDPLGRRGWWQTAEDPWQCLATCMELHAALESGDPLSYESSLPVHQDGTCNGLQHYAALGGDAQGAKQVNLSATERPSDVYSFVGGMVEKMLAEDAKRGDRFGQMLTGKVTRKVVKQTVMTTVYGVTFVGARDQIEKQLRDRKDLPEEECWLAASYLAKKVLMAIGDLFHGAKHIQTWLNLCARLISKSIPKERIPEALAEHKSIRRRRKVVDDGGAAQRTTLPQDRLKKEQMTSVVWTTPLGLPICQPYRKTTRKQVFTKVQTVYISDPNSPAEVNSMKQASAFPPNFIHSLDATHMMLTAIECRVQDLTFASVHDSYWTHASCIDDMSLIIRDTFIALHNSDVLQKLHTEFMQRYEGFLVPLVHLRSGGLVKQLKTAGSCVVVNTLEQAKSLEAIRDLVVVREDSESTVETHKTYDNLDGLLDQLKGLEEDEDEVEPVPENKSKKAVEREQEEEEAPPKKRTRGKGRKSLAAEELAAAEAAAAEEAALARKKRKEKKKAEDEFEQMSFEEEEEEALARAEAKKLEDARALAQLMGKFVPLTALLPPLPAKGNFKVELIKDSPYFFS